MTDPNLHQVQAALKAGDKAAARQLIKKVLQTAPSAEGWYLAAHAMDDNAQAIKCLKKALELDPWHNAANRYLLKLEGAPSLFAAPPRPAPSENDLLATQPLPDLKRKVRVTETQRRAQRRRAWSRIGCLGGVVLSMACSLFTFSLIGMVPGFIGTVGQLFGGPPPTTEIDGVPIREVPNAAALITPSKSVQASDRAVDVLDHGYVHEYTFQAFTGEEVLGYIQFMSLGASRVAKNILILNPDGDVAPDTVCVFLGDSGILGGQGNVTFSCLIDRSGTWRIRVLGVQGESIGAYFAGVESLGR